MQTQTESRGIALLFPQHQRYIRVGGQRHAPAAVKCEGKGNPVTGPGGPIGWVEVQLNFFLTSALEGGVWSASRPGRFYPREKPGTHRTGGWVGPKPVWIGAENLAPPGFDPRTFQPVASRNTDYAIPAPSGRFTPGKDPVHIV
jgi:hypothetical protein